MLIHYVQQALGLFEKADAILICDRDGYIEYAKWYKDWYFSSAEVVGKHILEVYPTLTKETSTILKCLDRREGEIDEEQYIETFKGQMVHIVNTTQPLIVDGEIIGAICASTFFDKIREQRAGGLNCSNTGLSTLDDIITRDTEMKRLKQQILNVARSNSTVLVYGETGTGKELVAESIHTGSPRKNQPFIAQNCAAIPATLLEGIFFGTEKGSFTGADTKKGLFELADKGTLFLDELNSMDFGIQAKILKVIEEKKVRRLGAVKDRRIDVRIICAMNEDPFEALKNGRLREDLFYRISVVQLRIPPLRERRKDIMLLADHFIRILNRELGRNVKGLSELAQNAFENQFWRGNVRELRNTLESAFINSSGDIITIKNLPETFFQPCVPTASGPVDLQMLKRGFSLESMVEQYEKTLIEQVLSSSANMSEAARRMKISRQRLKYKLEKYGLY